MKKVLFIVLFMSLVLCGLGKGWGRAVKNEGMSLLNKERNQMNEKIQNLLPSPHGELLVGLLFGVDGFNSAPRFNDIVSSTGIQHIVVVSGYNITLVYGFVRKILGDIRSISRTCFALFIAVIYVAFTGFGIPAVRALLMVVFVEFLRFYGYSVSFELLLIVTAVLIVVFSPSSLSSLSFQLSFLATAGLFYFSDALSFGDNLTATNVLVQDLKGTLAAQALIWPLLSYHFGTINVLGFVVNPLILWIVPIITTAGFVLFTLTLINSAVQPLFTIIMFHPLNLLILVTEYFASFGIPQINYKISFVHLLFYYVFVIVLILRKNFGGSSKWGEH